MSFVGKLLTFTFLHANQVDKPNSVFASSLLFKQAIDTQAQQCQTAINNIIDQLNTTTAGNSGAENLGSSLITGVAGVTAHDQLVDLKAQINAATLGAIPDGSLTGVKLANNTITVNKLKTDIPNLLTMGAMF